jgi:hypothetical protein
VRGQIIWANYPPSGKQCGLSLELRYVTFMSRKTVKVWIANLYANVFAMEHSGEPRHAGAGRRRAPHVPDGRSSRSGPFYPKLAAAADPC